jgi:hypothetical protein
MVAIRAEGIVGDMGRGRAVREMGDVARAPQPAILASVRVGIFRLPELLEIIEA